MGANGLNHETHEIHEREIQNHEWARISSIHYTDSLVVRGMNRWVHAFAPPTVSTLPLPRG